MSHPRALLQSLPRSLPLPLATRLRLRRLPTCTTSSSPHTTTTTSTTPRTTARYASSNSNSNTSATSFLQNSPSPPRLPADQQAEFERLQRAAEAALSSHNTLSSPSSSSSSQQQQQQDQPLTTSRHVSIPSTTSTQAVGQGGDVGSGESVSAGSFSAGIRQGAPPEFDGDKNPKTGEVGGPKNEPLRWGSGGDWSYNGRVTDF